jgi:lipid II:glycine glycyltransferase (peptidoglycan interpeptide bridge formation enzyme)
VAAAFNGYHGGTVEGMWAAADPSARELQPNYVLYWEMIQDACRRGFRRYHLGRSTAESGGEQFKKKWNAVSTQLHWYFGRTDGAAELPGLNVDNPKYRLAIAAWRRLPLWMTDLAGPPLARLIP